MEPQFEEYAARRIVNIHTHVNGPWFWDKYTAHPYVGCQSGCEFCYERSGRYIGRRDPETFDKIIRVKRNAAELLRQELGRLTPDVISCGDWQEPAERRYRLSQKMIEVVRDAGFPLLVVERSPLVARDLDLLTDINQRSGVGIVFSISSLDTSIKNVFEPRSPAVQLRLSAMDKFARAGILVGTALIPVLPFLGDDESSLEAVVRATKDNGGTFIIAGSLTMAGVQAERTLRAAGSLNPQAEAGLRNLYNWDTPTRRRHTPPRSFAVRVPLLVRALCLRHGLKDRMPRLIPPNTHFTNKRLAERLFLRAYDLELDQADVYRIWAYRKAAWSVDEWPDDVAGLYREHGESGIRTIPGIGKSLAREIVSWLPPVTPISPPMREGKTSP